jgi:hypothetical protein
MRKAVVIIGIAFFALLYFAWRDQLIGQVNGAFEDVDVAVRIWAR